MVKKSHLNYQVLKNIYPISFSDRLFLAKKIAVSTVPRKVISFSIPFMGIDSLKIRGKLIGLVKMYFPFCKIQVMFNSGNRLGSFFQFKDKVP